MLNNRQLLNFLDTWREFNRFNVNFQQFFKFVEVLIVKLRILKRGLIWWEITPRTVIWILNEQNCSKCRGVLGTICSHSGYRDSILQSGSNWRKVCPLPYSTIRSIQKLPGRAFGNPTAVALTIFALWIMGRSNSFSVLTNI